MKVKDLIAILQEVDPELPIVIPDYDHSFRLADIYHSTYELDIGVHPDDGQMSEWNNDEDMLEMGYVKCKVWILDP